MAKAPESIDAYIAGFPKDARVVLQKLRALIRAAIPRAEERISYGIPAFNLNGRYLVYFSGAREHVGLYPSPLGKTGFDAALKPYASGKATLRFGYDKPLPASLITKTVKFMAAAAAGRASAGKAKKPAVQKAATGKTAKSRRHEAERPNHVVKKVSKKAAKKTVKKASPGKGFGELHNLSWSLLKEVAPKNSAARKK